jgi:sulfur-oxidizing protein SoxY
VHPRVELGLPFSYQTDINPSERKPSVKTNRRTVLQATGAMATLVALGIVTAQQAHAAGRPGFDARTLQDALRTLGGAPATSNQISIASPDIAENGAVVPVTVISRLPKTTEMFVLVERNPLPLTVAFTIPEGTEAEIQTRLRMSESSNIVAVVRADGRLFSVVKETRVILGGCGG